jgi:hypothetical protein
MVVGLLRVLEIESTTSRVSLPALVEYMNFKEYYKASLKNPKQHNDLLLALMDVSFARMNGVKNPQYPPVLMNFCLAAHTISPKAAEFVGANLDMVTERHMLKIAAKRRGSPVIHRDRDSMIKIVVGHIAKLRSLMGEDKRIVWSVGVDATVVAKAYQHLAEHNVIVGGAHPNDWIELDSKDKNEVLSTLYTPNVSQW